MWIFSLTLVLIYLGAVYFDHHGGWFDANVYGPYSSADELDSYQPKSGAAAASCAGKKIYEMNCGTCHGVDGSANRDRRRRWPVRNGSRPRASSGSRTFR
jgi:mono/diheme cytochrome c family protein